ncbi:flagellar basal body rod protein FlgB [Effusibacillus pohliae]|uniref:flagellar basal body rod protein FlgB n=1 Tax=Effusibacillus pohliae TaxID=232270 RepID=UPI000368C73D|nr:flagellar basal body rod protein FlgB [Effusibacillus pohliae]
MSFINTKSMQIYERTLDAASLRQKELANNIANVDTPNFKRSDISFESTLQAYLEQKNAPIQLLQTDPRHIPAGPRSISQIQPEIIVENSTAVNNNGNNVDIDSEMTQLAVNQIKYNAVVQLISGHFNKLRTAIQGGGR